MNTRSPGTTNLFLAIEHKAGRRVVVVTDQRGKTDFFEFVRGLSTENYAAARGIHLVLDNLNIRHRICFDDVLKQRATGKFYAWDISATRPSMRAG